LKFSRNLCRHQICLVRLNFSTFFNKTKAITFQAITRKASKQPILQNVLSCSRKFQINWLYHSKILVDNKKRSAYARNTRAMHVHMEVAENADETSKIL